MKLLTQIISCKKFVMENAKFLSMHEQRVLLIAGKTSATIK